MAIPRGDPYIWVTWLTKLLVGEDSCEWAAWFKAHHTYERMPADFAIWQIAHTALVNKTRDELEADGLAVFTERQNQIKLQGASGLTIGGQPT